MRWWRLPGADGDVRHRTGNRTSAHSRDGDHAMDLDELLGESPWGFELAPPEVYVPLDPTVELEGDDLEAAAARLVDERAAVDELVASRRQEWVDHVVAIWQDARDKRALDAWTMVYDAEGLPARAYVLAFGAEREHPDDIDAEIRWLESAVSVPREGDAGERHVSVVTLPAGPAVRMRAMVELEPDKRRSLVVDVVEYWVPVPGEPDSLLLTFSTPVLVLADILAEIADDIARTLRFRS